MSRVMPRDLYPFDCPHCYADLELERFDGKCKCWHCGRPVRAVHDCVPPDDEFDSDGDCYDYTMPFDEEP